LRTFVVLALCFIACNLSFAQTPPKQRMVVVISLDGFPGYALDDPKLPIPTLRELIRTGRSTRMTTVNPTVTWPNHTAMMTGARSDRNGLFANGTIVKTGAWPPVKVEPMIEKEKMVHAPTVYDAAHKAGLTTAQVDWVAIHEAPSINWAFREWAGPDGALEQEMIQKGAVSAADIADFKKSNIVFRDEIWTKAAVHLIRERKPNLLLVHFLTLDSVHHTYGPGSLAARAAFGFLDGCVAKIVDAVRASGMADRTTFLVVSDHGFKKYTNVIRPGVAFAAAGIGDKAYTLAEGGSAYVYVDAALVSKAKVALGGVEGIEKVIGPEGFAGLGLPQPGKDPQMYQLLLTAKDGYSFSGSTGGPVTSAVPQEAGSHGYLASDPDMDAIFIASGYGVTPGSLPKIANVDVASTIASLLGVPLPGALGKPVSLK